MAKQAKQTKQTQQTQQTQAVATTRPIDAFKAELGLRDSMIMAMLPPSVPLAKFKTAVIAAVGGNPKLLECTRPSLMKACIEASELGLSLNPQLAEADILPVWNGRSKAMEAQFRPRYMGFMKLARQSGEVLTIRAQVVRSGDEFDYEEGLRPRLEHKPHLSNRGDMTHAYCVWKTRDGESQFEVMDRDQIETIKERSPAKGRDGKVVGPWATDEEEMWRKTVVRRASKYMPRSAGNFKRAVALDNLRESGEEVSIRDGEVMAGGAIVDITGVDDEKPNPRAVDQLDGLEKKMGGGKPEPEPKPEPEHDEDGVIEGESENPEPEPEPEKKAEPKKQRTIKKIKPAFGSNDDLLDWGAWGAASCAAIEALDSAEAVQAWESGHEQFLGQCELGDPEIASTVRDAIDARNQELAS